MGRTGVVVLTCGENVETDLLGLQGEVTIALIRSASVGVRPVVGSVVTSPTLKTPGRMRSANQ